MLEGMAIWAVMFRRLDLTLVAGHDVVMTSGATIHTRDGMLVNARRRTGEKGQKVDWAHLEAGEGHRRRVVREGHRGEGFFRWRQVPRGALTMTRRCMISHIFITILLSKPNA